MNIDEMIEAARNFGVRALDKTPNTAKVAITAPAYIAFRRPTFEEEYCQRILHCDPCGKSSMFYPGRECAACVSERREHDPGDEDC